MANILIYSNNPQLIAEWTHALVADHHVSRLLNVHVDYQADAVLIDARKLDEDASLFAQLSNKQTRYLVLGADWPEQKQIDVLVHGAAGYCEQSEAPKCLMRAIDCILSGDIWVKRALVPKVIGILTGSLQSTKTHFLPVSEREGLHKILESLSARETEVADMIRQGQNNKSIALALNISERTVKAHLSSIFRKFGVDDRLHLAIQLKEIDRYL